ncbi:YqeG family HAD IIIA-type phosphatase [Apilactobacillus ozensis]|uniref:HAD superfamily hydrolase n=1 Tax=Apilactobacillus ozensis DSM 23829 = JCM 17196 TaxID=1423781 RepID=A0A0R2AN48_9LACO|nr:YqeG family HAD IIIA-type phosphatase [Apilactobacillus ozensis]KRM68122.1 HAD superfamily hydrolase [Apilactobacillus ozensis DSM 23829 = JCM 17196]MCK8606625.1 YqeG family HAD IIIA-type phosphatase [Apilactobacillus ozensis]
MLSKFKPTWMIPTIYQISPSRLNKMGIKAVFTDLDNTLIPWNNTYGTNQLKSWISELDRYEIKLVIISNNSYKRVGKAVQNFRVDYIARAYKPLPTGLNKALKKYNLNSRQVIMIGDQLLTDVVASNNAGVRSVLVKPVLPSDAWNTKLNRFIEKKIWKKLFDKYNNLTWQEDIDERN